MKESSTLPKRLLRKGGGTVQKGRRKRKGLPPETKSRRGKKKGKDKTKENRKSVYFRPNKKERNKHQRKLGSPIKKKGKGVC